jgi:hypothetical protein
MGAHSFWLAAIAFVACCEASANLRHVQGPDGRRWWELSCRRKSACWEELSRQCPEGYEVLDQTTEIHEDVVAYRIGNTYMPVVGHRQSTALLFRCKNDPPYYTEGREPAASARSATGASAPPPPPSSGDPLTSDAGIQHENPFGDPPQ